MSGVEWLRRLSRDALHRRTFEEIEQARAAQRVLFEAARQETKRTWEPFPGQVPPEGDWRVWMILAGRGFGKTRAGAEWVTRLARGNGRLRIALVGATLDEVESVMVRGAAGLMAVAATPEDLLWYPSRRLVEFASGAQAFAYSGETPDKLRGPEHHFAWVDELAKYPEPDELWENLLLGLRAGHPEDGHQRVLVTTTPRAIPLLQKLEIDPQVRLARGKTRDNPHLSAAFVADVTARYGGTRLGRQELDGEILADVEGALWTRELVERCRVTGFRTDPHHPTGCAGGSSVGWTAPHAVQGMPGACPTRHSLPLAGEGCLVRVVIGVDPPASAAGDACGIVACGLGEDGVGYVLADHSVGGLSPDGWARRVAAAAEVHGADRVIAEANQGGDMVASVLRAADCGLPVKLVHARHGKAARAEPVAALFESGKARFAGTFPELEDELCALQAGRPPGARGRSPDRADAMVWAMTELMLGGRGTPAVRGF